MARPFITNLGVNNKRRIQGVRKGRRKGRDNPEACKFILRGKSR